MFKLWLRRIIWVTLELAVIAGIFFVIFQNDVYRKFQEMMPSTREVVEKATQSITQGNVVHSFPALTGPAVKTYTWKYRGATYSISQTLYDSVNEFYQNEPKSYKYLGTPAENWEDEYYGMFLRSNDDDPAVAALSQEIATAGRKNKLNEDQIAELVLSFVQTIPYDDTKAKAILSGDEGVSMEYPYETLFTNSGVCSDKSFLATALLRSLGYGTAIFTYDAENHMAIGIQCPKEYSTYQSGYCYAETTSTGNRIGIIPSLDAVNNKASALISAENFNLEQNQNSASRQLGEVRIFQKSTGKSYEAIIGTLATEKEIVVLQKEIKNISSDLTNRKNSLTQDESNLKSMKNELDSLKQKGEVDKYNALVEKYNKNLENYRKKVETYNKTVSLYNQKVKRYNALLQY